MSMPIDDERVLSVARQDILARGWTSGFMARDAYNRACGHGSGFWPTEKQLGPTASWTAALKRLVARGDLVVTKLVGPRGGKNTSLGFDLPYRAEMRRERAS